MKALVLKEYNRLVYEDVPDPVPGAGEVLVRVKACGICGSDVHGMDGSTGRRIPPLIMGHEASGVIEALGPETSSFRVGERVTFDSTVYCGTCWHCLRGEINLCDNRRVLGVSCAEYRRDGAFAEYLAVPQRILYRLPEGLSFQRAALVEPVSIAVHGVERLSPRLGSSAVVVGAGVIGLLVVQALKAAGCGLVIAVDVAPDRLETARRLGADAVLNPRDGDTRTRLFELTGGRGADGAIEAVGTSSALETAVLSLRKGAALILIGNLSPLIEFPLQAVVTREISVHGSCASRGEYPAALDMIASRRIDVDALISAEAPLRDGAEWFRLLAAKEPGLTKVVLVP